MGFASWVLLALALISAAPGLCSPAWGGAEIAPLVFVKTLGVPDDVYEHHVLKKRLNFTVDAMMKDESKTITQKEFSKHQVIIRNVNRPPSDASQSPGNVTSTTFSLESTRHTSGRATHGPGVPGGLGYQGGAEFQSSNGSGAGPDSGSKTLSGSSTRPNKRQGRRPGSTVLATKTAKTDESISFTVVLGVVSIFTFSASIMCL